ncbi:FIST N-terminal domain-containing protein [Actibacterium pelagium]|uniref:GfdT protein n=1 Tax=Actibacterium pelagium TaxID=2029103 RepID=A0A917AI66_9RHOB|nr:FIST N-terminal domain-containing protein [Actibacterium pelagium]GGE54656.1 hypothetical protein GCM10011517_22890 [Actibacterium pelagium]
MDQTTGLSSVRARAPQILRAAVVDCDTDQPIAQLAAELGPDPMAFVALFLSPNADLHTLAAQTTTAFGEAAVMGCTTAGEIADTGYSEGKIVAVGLPASQFSTRILVVEDLKSFNATKLIDRMIQTRHALKKQRPEWDHEFNFMMIDGLSTLEDRLTSEIAAGLGPVPLFGGSAGDGDRFGETFLLHDGQVLTNAALIAQFRTNCPVRVFKTDHFEPSDRRMVVTKASPDRRIVHEINAEPAAREYARLVGKDPNQLSPFTFAAHPLVVRVGGHHHVRAIQQVAENGDLIFFSAIDEGLVLTLAETKDMVDHLETELAALSAEVRPDGIIACDCILRRIEAEQSQLTGQLSNIMAHNNVVGFSTYGEQINSMHVNQTLTGVAIYPPES